MSRFCKAQDEIAAVSLSDNLYLSLIKVVARGLILIWDVDSKLLQFVSLLLIRVSWTYWSITGVHIWYNNLVLLLYLFSLISFHYLFGFGHIQTTYKFQTASSLVVYELSIFNYLTITRDRLFFTCACKFHNTFVNSTLKRLLFALLIKFARYFL